MAKQTMNGMPGMSTMPGMGDPTRTDKNTDPTRNQKGMDTSAPPLQTPGPHMVESMKNMPMATPKRVWTVTGTEDWTLLRGFGKAAGMVGMMNGMMVGGGAMQNMKMGKMDMSMAEQPAPTPEEARSAPGQAPAAPTVSPAKAAITITPDPPVVGDNTLDIAVTNADGRPITGLKLAATVAMVTMDMGTAHPAVTEMGSGHYRTKISLSMAGPWRVVLAGGEGANAVKQTLDLQAGGTKASSQAQSPQSQAPQAQSSAPASAGPLTVTAALASGAAKTGEGNILVVTVTDAAGRPVTGAHVTSSAAMVTMDMGTTHPVFKDMGNGKYKGTVGFSMAGPWRVTVKAAVLGRPPQTKAFDFTAK